MGQFRKRPLVVRASRAYQRQVIDTLEGRMIAEAGDWIITGVNGELYPCKDETFRKTYEPVDRAAEAAWDGKDDDRE